MTDHDARTQELFNRTILSWNEAEVQALRERNLSTEAIADRLQMPESTVDDLVQQIEYKTERARSTLEEISGFTVVNRRQ